LHFVLFFFFIYIYYILFGRVTSHRARYRRRVEIKYILSRSVRIVNFRRKTIYEYFSRTFFTIYTRHYDIYRMSVIFLFLLLLFVIFFLTTAQNPDIIIIMRRGSRVIFEIDLFGLLLYLHIIHISRFPVVSRVLATCTTMTSSRGAHDTQVCTIYKKNRFHQTIS